MRPLDARRARLLLLAYAGITGALALVTALLGLARGPDPMGHFLWTAGASVAVIGSLVAIAGLWSATGVYAAVFWCFHFGLVAVLAIGVVEPLELSIWDLGWVLGPFAADAAAMALAGSLAFAAGATLVHARRRSTLTHVTPTRCREAHPHGAAGSLLVFAAIGLWCAIVLTSSGMSGFFGSYGDYLDAASDFGVGSALVWLVLGCGLVLSITGKHGRLRTATMAAFGALVLVVLPLGLRGEILFVIMAAIVASARCGYVLSPIRTIACGIVLLVAIPLVREVRQTGLRALPDAIPELRWYDAFAEMGGSLHPVETVVRWRAEGEPLDRGGTYWAPFERAAGRLLPGVQNAAAEDDLRIMNVLVTDRVGAIGFSPVAEAYRNFGALGVVIVMGLLGAVMAAIDTIRNRRIAVLTIAIVYAPLLTNVRNSFIAVPAHCAVGLAIVLAVSAIRHVAGSVVGKPHARAAYIRSEV